MRCTAKKTLQIAVDSGNDALVQLKGNQPTLLRAMEALSEQSLPVDTHHHDHIGQRNRIESRTTSVWPVPADAVDPSWKYIRCLIRVRRHTEVFETTRAAWVVRKETAWYVCTKELCAQEAAQAVRDHWQIENALHYVRDVTMREDASRIRRQPGVFAQLRTWSLNLLRQAGHKNINAARQIIAWAEDELLRLFANL